MHGTSQAQVGDGDGVSTASIGVERETDLDLNALRDGSAFSAIYQSV
jgi:hypothetical protein